MSSSSNNSKFKCNHSSQKKSKWTKIGSRKANGKAKGFKPQKPQKQPVQPREGLVQPRELSNRFEYLSEELSDESDYLDEFPAVAPVSRRWKFQRKKKSYKAVARTQPHSVKKRVRRALLPRQSSRLTKRRRGSRTRSPVQPRSACGDASSRKHTSRTEFSEKYRPTSVESPIVMCFFSKF